MKIKNSIPLASLCLLLATSCKKKDEPAPAEPAPAPSSAPTATTDPYTYNSELQSSKDISYAISAITDIMLMCGHAGENQLTNLFFQDAPGTATSSSGTLTLIRDMGQKNLVVAFNKTRCVDGHDRDGALFFAYGYDPVLNPGASPNAGYYREYGFAAAGSPISYVVDGWKIELFDPARSAFIWKKRSSAFFNP